jgi:transcriptional regulator with XRE-family HTH domain
MDKTIILHNTHNTHDMHGTSNMSNNINQNNTDRDESTQHGELTSSESAFSNSNNRKITSRNKVDPPDMKGFTESKKSFGKGISRFRRAVNSGDGLTQDDVESVSKRLELETKGEFTSLSASLVSEIENGRYSPSIMFLKTIAYIYQMTPDDLYTVVMGRTPVNAIKGRTIVLDSDTPDDVYYNLQKLSQDAVVGAKIRNRRDQTIREAQPGQHKDHVDFFK